MSNEINYRHTDTGHTLYFTVESGAGLIWNGTSLVSMAVADWATYDVAMTETPASGYRYLGSMPGVAAGKYTVRVWRQFGAAPAITDPLLSTGELGWTGTAECSVLNYLSDTTVNYRSAATGLTLYATFESLTAATVWNGSAMETMAVANWATYDVALTETPAGGYRYLAAIPGLATGRYRVTVYQQLGGSPAATDTVLSTGEVSVFASDTPVRRQILAALAARLATITTANGYRTDLGLDVHEWQPHALDPGESTLRVEYRDEAGTTGYIAVGEHLHTLPVTLRIVAKNNTSGSALTTVRDAVADVYQALHTDLTFGGLAEDTNQTGSVKEDYGEAADRAAGAEVVYTIEYVTEPGTP